MEKLNTDELKKLYQEAQNARKTGNKEKALECYLIITENDPDNWEALFYSVALKEWTEKCIESFATGVTLCLEKVFRLISTKVDDETEKKKAVKEVVDECHLITKNLTNVTNEWFAKANNYSVLQKLNIFCWFYLKQRRRKELIHMATCLSLAGIMRVCGDCVEKYFGMNDEDYKDLAVYSWKSMQDLNYEYGCVCKTSLYYTDLLIQYSTKINKYDSSYEIYSKENFKRKIRK